MDKVILETVSMTEITSFTNLREYYVYVATEYSPAQRLRGLKLSSEESRKPNHRSLVERLPLAVSIRIAIASAARHGLVECSPLTVSFADKILYKV